MVIFVFLSSPVGDDGMVNPFALSVLISNISPISGKGLVRVYSRESFPASRGFTAESGDC